MTNMTELLERFEELAVRAENDDDVARPLRELARDLDSAAESQPDAEKARELADRARDARGYADRLDRWFENLRAVRSRRKQEEDQ